MALCVRHLLSWPEVMNLYYDGKRRSRQMEAMTRVRVEKLALNLLSNLRRDICNGRRGARRLLSPATLPKSGRRREPVAGATLVAARPAMKSPYIQEQVLKRIRLGVDREWDAMQGHHQ